MCLKNRTFFYFIFFLLFIEEESSWNELIQRIIDLAIFVMVNMV